MRTFRLRYQLSPAAQACAPDAEVVGLAKSGKASLSTSNSAKRPTTCHAPQPPPRMLKGGAGITPRYEAFSPVKPQPAETSHAVFLIVAEATGAVVLVTC